MLNPIHLAYSDYFTLKIDKMLRLFVFVCVVVGGSYSTLFQDCGMYLFLNLFKFVNKKYPCFFLSLAGDLFFITKMHVIFILIHTAEIYALCTEQNTPFNLSQVIIMAYIIQFTCPNKCSKHNTWYNCANVSKFNTFVIPVV